MILAYRPDSLDRLLISDATSRALDKKLITQAEYQSVQKLHAVDLYTPNIFIRAGIFLLTVFITLMGSGLLWMITGASSDKEMGMMCLFLSLIWYATLEYVVRQTKHYQSGLDDALIWLSAGFAIAAVNLLFFPVGHLVQCLLIVVLSGFATIRYANSLMAGIVILSLLAVVFYSVLPLGIYAKAILPILLMVSSILLFWWVRKNKKRFIYYRGSLKVAEVVSLFTAYSTVNFFVVREVSNELIGLPLPEKASIPGGWLFWMLTIAIPVVYIYRALQKKEIVLLRVGLLLTAATLYTIYYYYPLASIEIILVGAGIVLIGVAYGVARYLAVPRFGIINSVSSDLLLPGMEQLESLIIAESFHDQPAAESDGTSFGGGTAGGGGASGQY